jgi:hypothetical protein
MKKGIFDQSAFMFSAARPASSGDFALFRLFAIYRKGNFSRDANRFPQRGPTLPRQRFLLSLQFQRKYFRKAELF